MKFQLYSLYSMTYCSAIAVAMTLSRATTAATIGEEDGSFPKIRSSARAESEGGRGEAPPSLGSKNDENKLVSPDAATTSRGLGSFDCNFCGSRFQIPPDANLRELLDDCLSGDTDDEKTKCPGTVSCWDTSGVTDMSRAFAGRKEFNEPLNCWDVSRVRDMSGMFYGAEKFNQPLGTWQTSSVTSMNDMFRETDHFDQDIDSWDVSSVQDLSGMFCESKAFDKPLGSWKTSSVTSMQKMFNEAEGFNHPVEFWDVSSVQDMSGMFLYSVHFNQPLGRWKTTSVTTMERMFRGTRSFNEFLGTWKVSSVKSMEQMFDGSSFNQPINHWDVSNVHSMRMMFLHNEAFNQCLSSWPDEAGRLSNKLAGGNGEVNTENMFSYSGCPQRDEANPVPGVGPWCRFESSTCHSHGPLSPSSAAARATAKNDAGSKAFTPGVTMLAGVLAVTALAVYGISKKRRGVWLRESSSLRWASQGNDSNNDENPNDFTYTYMELPIVISPENSPSLAASGTSS